MKIKKGTSRTALVGERLTVKIATPMVAEMLEEVIPMIRERNWNLLKHYMTKSDDDRDTFAYTMLRGWRENRREARLSSMVSDSTIVPTRASIFGVINIQETAQPAPIKDVETFRAIGKKLTSAGINTQDKLFKKAKHTLLNKKNYGIHDGKLKLVDYGEAGVCMLIEQFGYLIEEALAEELARVQASTGK